MNPNQALLVITTLAAAFAFPGSSFAALEPQNIYIADTDKSHVYVRDAVISGGDRAISEVTVKGIRRAQNRGFERVVLDLEGSRSGQPAAIPRAPYFQVASEPEKGRVVVTLWGDPKLHFDARGIRKVFSGSRMISNIELLPRLEDDSWTFALNLREDASIEVFELKNPVRLILDLKEARKAQTVSLE